MRNIPLAPAARMMGPALMLILLLPACDEDNTILVDPRGAYVPLTSPENLVTNLQVSYRRQEFNKYAEILAPEFVFKFQPQDAQDLGFDSWNRDQDSTGTDALFRTPQVGDIRIQLTHTGAQDPMEVGFDPGTKKIRINPTFLEVDQIDGITWMVDGDIQDMFFRKGTASAGEDTTRWFLFEWRDLPGPPPSVSVHPEAVQTVSWGRTKARYEPF